MGLHLHLIANIISRKILKQKVSINPGNTYLDLDNTYLRAYPTDQSIYPCILALKNGDVTDIHYQSPKEDGFLLINSTNP